MKTKKYLGVVLILSFISFSAFAATWDSVDPLANETETVSIDEEITDSWASDVSAEEENTEIASEEQNEDAWDLNAAGPSSVLTLKWWIWNYPEVACDKDYFTQNACNQCFDWWIKATWEKLSNLTDSWTNPNSTEQVIYKDEQTLPEMVNVWGAATKWISNPVDTSNFWKFSEEIVWTDSKTWTWKQEFLLEWGKTVNFLESDLWANYVLNSTDKKEWEAVWILKFPINYHNIDASWKESGKLGHIECVAYKAWAQALQKPLPPAKEVTKVKTWPEFFIFILAAMMITLWLAKFRKKTD
ncbi:MAG: hypothetical protein ACD_4C00262G0004 [uncultured bacterium (gcode 4)]|uniref:Uncharacterized protein n=1 Tax=uncultured bacterium (gcode 4) TaxID=1234023 RepID=K2FU95_9BACT|nr:MAG: hypothetical protein ACD_4C00262G0004 [uncultured bacterium (gcode 4)]